MTEPLFKIGADGRWIFHIDHHLVSSFLTCETAFRYGKIECHKPKGKRAVLGIGIWWASVMEEFYKQMRRDGKCPSKFDIVMIAARAWREHDMESLAIYEPKKLEKFAGRISRSALGEFDDIGDIPAGAIWMAMRYYEAQAKHDANNWQIIGVEDGFGLRDEVPLGENDSVVVFYTGKPDLVIRSKNENELMPVDHKTVEYIESGVQKKYKPHAQTTGYIYATQMLANSLGMNFNVSRCILNIAARNEPAENPKDGKAKPRFTRVFPTYSPAEIDEWRINTIEIVTDIRRAIEKEHFKMRHTSCHLYGGCQFRGVCSVPPGVRQLIFDADFVKSERWTPYKIEDE